jgi:hypothetical protein
MPRSIAHIPQNRWAWILKDRMEETHKHVRENVEVVFELYPLIRMNHIIYGVPNPTITSSTKGFAAVFASMLGIAKHSVHLV